MTAAPRPAYQVGPESSIMLARAQVGPSYGVLSGQGVIVLFLLPLLSLVRIKVVTTKRDTYCSVRYDADRGTPRAHDVESTP